MNHPLRLLFSIPAILLAFAVGVNAQGKEEPSAVPTTLTGYAVSTTTPPTTVAPTTTMPLVLTDEQLAYLYDLGVEKARETWGKCGEWHDLAIAVGWPEAQWEYLQQVIFRESRCQVDAWNGHDAGLMQINQIHTDFIAQMGLGSHPDGMFIAENNLRFGLKLWEGSGNNCWRHWRFSGTTFKCTK